MIIKEIPEEFIVEEIPKNLNFSKKGDYCYFTIEKKNMNTLDVIKEIAKKLHIRERNFNIAGIKDKKALTKQVVSCYRISVRDLKRIKIPNVNIEFIGYGDERVKLGQLEANRFKIVVRDLENKGRNIDFIENYFDEQRFSGRNALLGRMLVKREFRKFCYTLRLKWKEGDYVNAIRVVPKKRLIFYINAYQSWMWNEIVVEYLKRQIKEHILVDYSQGQLLFSEKKLKNVKIPIIGYATVFEDKFIEQSYKELLDKEKIKQEDFMIKELPELISEGSERSLYADVKDFKIKYGKDEKYNDKLKANVEFSLQPGSYATIAVKKMFS